MAFCAYCNQVNLLINLKSCALTETSATSYQFATKLKYGFSQNFEINWGLVFILFNALFYVLQMVSYIFC